MISIFISHSSLDDARVRESIVGPLTQHGFSLWYSRDAIHAAEQWEKHIRKGLEGTEWFLVALSPNSVQSDWVRAEVDWAFEHRLDMLVPALIEDCNPDECHLRLRQIQYVDLRENNPSGLKQLLQVWNVGPTAVSAITITDHSNTDHSKSVNGTRLSNNEIAPSYAVDEDLTNEFGPYQKSELLQLRKKVMRNLLLVKSSVVGFTEATMPFQRRIEIADLEETLNRIDRELAART